MKFSATNLKWFKPFIILLISAHLYSCSRWYVLKEPYTNQINDDKPKLVEVELYNGERIVIYNPSIQGDTLTGFKKGESLIGFNTPLYQYQKDTLRYQRETLSIALCRVNQIKEVKIDTGLTILLIGVIVGIVIVVAISSMEMELDMGLSEL